MADLIYRQAALEAIVNTVSRIGLHDNSEVARYGATFRQHEIIDIVENLPSAQPKKKEPCSVCEYLEKGDTLYSSSSGVKRMDDLISRQAVLSLAKDVTLGNGAKHRCIDATEVNLLPSAQPERWIPVSERQPEEYGNYQVSTSMGLVVTDYYASFGWDDDCGDNYVVAWRPLPEPYKE